LHQHARVAGPRQSERDERIRARFRVKDPEQRARFDGDGSGPLAIATVEHRRHAASAPRSSRFVLAERLARRRLEYRFHLLLSSHHYTPRNHEGAKVDYCSLELCQTNSDETDVSSWMLLIACPSRRATESTLIFLHVARSPFSGIVLVTISWSIGDASSRSTAGPERTPCTAHASTRSAPLASSADAAFVIVPAVSMMSS